MHSDIEGSQGKLLRPSDSRAEDSAFAFDDFGSVALLPVIGQGLAEGKSFMVSLRF